MRLGIFGGSFDPVHNGHLLLAECCAEQADLDQVWFIPTACQPFKPAGPVASDVHRLAMLKQACIKQNEFHVSGLEINRGGISYTIDTLERISTEYPDADLFLLMGADSLDDLPTWHRAKDICFQSTPVVVGRKGVHKPDFNVLSSLISSEHIDHIRQHQVEMPSTPISSSEIRDLIVTGGKWQSLVPPTVATYIEEHRLYTNDS